MAAVGIIGAGTWGTALAVLLNNNGQDVTIWSAFDTEIQEMSRTRRHKNLPEVVLPDQIQMTADLRTAMAEKDMLIMAVPSVYACIEPILMDWMRMCIICAILVW